ncbi:MAG: DNA starvation/stationary phase protection protein [Sphingomonas sp.]|nr:MAG: DNA starvation/stationary phase protection protein [Sphingomonas sp.]
MSTATENRNLRTPTDIPANAVTPLAKQLNVTLANFLALYLKTKNFHWHVSGPHFRDYHLLLDDQATDIFNAVDEIAERVRKIGATTLRSIGDVTRHQTLKDNDSEFVAARDMLLELREDNLRLVEDLRAAKQLADDAKDNATSALIDEWTDQAEKRVWFLFEAARP